MRYLQKKICNRNDCQNSDPLDDAGNKIIVFEPYDQLLFLDKNTSFTSSIQHVLALFNLYKCSSEA